MTRLLTSLLISFCFYSTTTLQAQSIVMVANYDTAAPGDTLIWEYRMSGDKDSFSGFKVEPLDGFEELTVLTQSNSKQEQIGDDGRIHLTKSYTTIRAAVRAQRAGRFHTGSATAVWNKRDTIHSEPKWFTLRAGHKNKTKVGEEDPFFENFYGKGPLRFPAEKSNRSQLQDEHFSIAASNKKYIVILGWIQPDTSGRNRGKEQVRKGHELLQKREGIKMIDTDWHNPDPPRYYYETNDTIGLRAAVSSVAGKNDGKGNVVLAIAVRRDWTILKETYAFDYEEDKLRFLSALEHYEPFIALQRDKKTLPLTQYFAFTDLKQMERFVVEARRLGYSDLNYDTTLTKEHYLYTAGFRKAIPASLSSASASINELTEEGTGERSRAVLMWLRIKEEEKESEKK